MRKLSIPILSVTMAALAACTTVRLITVDPGHFHASLVQKTMYANVDPVVHVYAPGGEASDDLAEHLKRIDSFNGRAADPTHWQEVVYTGPDFFEKMLGDRAGNVVVLAGNNAKKTDYILRSVEAGMNVLGDKPMVITPADYPKLEKAFAVAAQKHVLLYDIMTERYEITTLLLQELSRQPVFFGTLEKGTAADPAIIKESVHYFSKTVAGAPLKRPAWFFDVRQEGEALTDVATHLVDLVQIEAFPEKALSPADAVVTAARHWPTALSPAQFKKVTGMDSFPGFLQGDVKDGTLQVYANGEFTYSLRGEFARIKATWDFEAAAGGDAYHALTRGTRATLEIRQGAAEAYKPVLYVRNTTATSPGAFEKQLIAAIRAIVEKYPGIGYERQAPADLPAGIAEWAITVPAKYDVGHEAHFAQVTENFLKYLHDGRLSAWEAPDMLTKYATTIRACAMCQ